MNEFDKFMKHGMKVKYYARYTDDFVIVADTIEYLHLLLPLVRTFLKEELLLDLHPRKIEIKRCVQGIDFLGYVVLPYHISVRTKTVRRMMRKLKERVMQFKSGGISETVFYGSLRSYLGVLSHADAYGLKHAILNKFWYWLRE